MRVGDRVRHPTLGRFGGGTVVELAGAAARVRWDLRVVEEMVMSDRLTWILVKALDTA